VKRGNIFMVGPAGGDS